MDIRVFLYWKKFSDSGALWYIDVSVGVEDTHEEKKVSDGCFGRSSALL